MATVKQKKYDLTDDCERLVMALLKRRASLMTKTLCNLVSSLAGSDEKKARAAIQQAIEELQ